MAVTVNLYTLSKVRNSTKQPSTSSGSYSCVLKEGTDVWNPTFILTGDPHNCNYCSAFGNYYYVDRIDYVPPHWHLTCTLDSMATWKSQIGNASLYVTRANSSAQRNEYLVDTLPSKVGPAGDRRTIMDVFDGQTPSYVVTIAAGTSSTGCDHWVFSESGYQTFVKQFMDTSGWDFSAAYADLEKGSVDPITYIKDVRWYPFTPDHGTLTNVIINNWDTGAQGYPMDDGYVFVLPTETVDVPRHPQAQDYGEFLNGNQYSSHTWVDPFFGVISVDANITVLATSLKYSITVDPSCGSAHMRLWAESSAQAYIIADRDCELGVPVMFSVYNRGIQNMASGFVGAIADVATLNFGSMINNLIGVVGAARHPKMQTTGSVGSKAMYDYAVILYSEFVRVEPLDPTTMGFPVCKTLTISSLSGFVQVAKGDVPVPGPSWAAAEIKSYLEGGFYYE